MSEELERWRYPRFFSDNIDPDSDTIVIDSEDAKHITSVLRMKKGDKAIICDKNCTDYLCELDNGDKNYAEFRIIESKRNSAEPDIEITLFQAVPKNDKLDFIVQKATELGATRIVPFISKRCVSKPDSKSAEKKVQRLQRICYEASKQCGRGIIPEVMPFTDFKSAVNSIDNDTTALIFYECGGEKIKNIDLSKKKIAIFIGSEGGFEKEEVDFAISKGFISAYLGERILRCETAPIAALAVLMNVTENL
ncbi:MAG: 16S rRNA (uracil(1498)-N(3))-methyltransferase [Ruminiclostridium sp.]|nr:16S rRNA (uracil(1498)-N(3))-methyltransferase [Ruminiclostridium sp.]MBQ8932578.1 16S rRNA (uracil(1498)-N(3))-methyltransferase [Ruminiclostridium sp.]